jgi:hypothetical protein
MPLPAVLESEAFTNVKQRDDVNATEGVSMLLNFNNMAADAPGFREALEQITIPPEMMLLYQHCLAELQNQEFRLCCYDEGSLW